MKKLFLTLAGLAVVGVAAAFVAPYHAALDCGSLTGYGLIKITIGGQSYITPIECGRSA